MNVIKFPAKKNPPTSKAEIEDFGDRLSRIRNSLEKINNLVVELKKMSGETNVVNPKR